MALTLVAGAVKGSRGTVRPLAYQAHLLWECDQEEKACEVRNDEELEATLERIRHLQAQRAHLRNTETNPPDYRLSSSGFISEIDRMQLEVREYLSTPAAVATSQS